VKVQQTQSFDASFAAPTCQAQIQYSTAFPGIHENLPPKILSIQRDEYLTASLDGFVMMVLVLFEDGTI
jgi:hypothetical protein